MYDIKLSQSIGYNPVSEQQYSLHLNLHNWHTIKQAGLGVVTE